MRSTLRDVLLTADAWLDLRRIIRYSERRYGSVQADRYEDTILAAVRALRSPIEPPGSRDHGHGFRRLHIERQRRKGSHIVFYRVVSEADVLVVRILHERRDFDRHLPRQTWL